MPLKIIIMKQNLYIISIGLAAIGALLVGIIMLWPDGSTGTAPATTLPVLPTEGGQATNNQISETNFTEVRIAGGEKIQIIDPRTLPNVTDFGSGMFQVTALEPDTDQLFGVIFNDRNGSFAVSLDREPLAQARLAAEQYLLSMLGVSQAELCQLQVYIGTAVTVNPFFSGDNLGVSFCPGSVALE